MQTGWRYYKHALVSQAEPHEEVTAPRFPLVCKEGVPVLARWTSAFDCGEETSWWYVIKDTPFDIASLKAKRRYEITKGKKNFAVRRIRAADYTEELLNVVRSAYTAWPESYRPNVDPERFQRDARLWNRDKVVYAGFDRENDEMCAFAYLIEYPGHVEFSVLRSIPEKESKGINAAMVAQIVEDYSDRLGAEYYINDGERSISHETAFQDYLEKYFGFRKAYCHLNVTYRFPINLVVSLLVRYRDHIDEHTKIGKLLMGVIRMEDYKG